MLCGFALGFGGGYEKFKESQFSEWVRSKIMLLLLMVTVMVMVMVTMAVTMTMMMAANIHRVASMFQALFRGLAVH